MGIHGKYSSMDEYWVLGKCDRISRAFAEHLNHLEIGHKNELGAKLMVCLLFEISSPLEGRTTDEETKRKV